MSGSCRGYYIFRMSLHLVIQNIWVMKIISSLLLTMAVGGSIISCGKNDPHVNPAHSPLYGSWKSIGLVVTGCTNPSTNHSTTNCCDSGSALCCGYIEFTSTTMTSSGVTGSRSSSYTINGNTYNYPSDGGVPTIFTIADTILTLSYQQTVNNGNCLIVTTYTKN